MAVSVRMSPLLEKELELAAQRQGVTKSQFIIDAVERALGRQNPYELMMKLKAEAEQEPKYERVREAYAGYEQPYGTEQSRAWLIARLKAKHGSSAD